MEFREVNTLIIFVGAFFCGLMVGWTTTGQNSRNDTVCVLGRTDNSPKAVADHQTLLRPRPSPTVSAIGPTETAEVKSASNDHDSCLLTRANRRFKVWDWLRQPKEFCQNKNVFIENVKDAVVVEVGSFEGEELHFFKQAKKIYVFEPISSKFGKIESSIQSNGIAAKTEFFKGAASNKDGEITFYENEGGSQQDAMISQPSEWGSKKISVPSYRLDTIVKERVHLLKIDVQGAEAIVLEGATKLLEQGMIDIIHMEISPGLARHANLDPAEQLRIVYKYGYVCFECQEFDPPPLSAPHGIEEYANHFGKFDFKGADHGAWADLVCII